MKLSVTTRRFPVTPELREYAEEKIKKLARYEPRGTGEARLILWTERYRKCAELTLHLRGAELVGTADDTDMHVAIDQVVDRMERRLKKVKDKRTDRKGKLALGAAMSGNGAGEVEEEEDDDA